MLQCRTLSHTPTIKFEWRIFDNFWRLTINIMIENQRQKGMGLHLRRAFQKIISSRIRLRLMLLDPRCLSVSTTSQCTLYDMSQSRTARRAFCTSLQCGQWLYSEGIGRHIVCDIWLWTGTLLACFLGGLYIDWGFTLASLRVYGKGRSLWKGLFGDSFLPNYSDRKSGL